MREIKEIPYMAGGRELCVTGTCVLTASCSTLGKAIRHFEGKDAFCSHAAPVVRFPAEMVREERVTLIEALEHGMTPTYMSHYFSDFEGDLFLFVPDGLTPKIQEAFRFWLIDKMLNQTEYDYPDLVKQLFGRVKQDDNKLFCSEAWGFAIEFAGIDRRADAPQDYAPQPPDVSEWWDGTLYRLTGPFTHAK